MRKSSFLDRTLWENGLEFDDIDNLLMYHFRNTVNLTEIILKTNTLLTRKPV